MQFAQPIFLWALAGLSIPIAIHLLSRKEGKVIRLGSLRHLQETSTQKFKGIKLNEILLLALRSLLIILFVLLISGIYWHSENDKRWLVVENGLEKNPIAKKLIDSLTKQGFEQHQLQKGFPTGKLLENAKSDHWEMVSSLAQFELQQAIVLSYSRSEDFTGIRKAIAKNIQWITFPPDSSNFIAEVIQQMPEQTFIRRGYSSPEQTVFETEISTKPIADSIKIEKLPVSSILIVSDLSFENDKQIVKSALAAISKKLPIELTVRELPSEKVSNKSSDWLIWLSETAVPKIDSVKVISYSIKSSNQLLELVAENRWTINKRLSIDVALQENLTLQLAAILIPEKEKWNAVAHFDRRILPDRILFSGTQSNDTKASATLTPPINKYMVLLFLFVLLVERAVAYHRNQ
jgi:hypothetical protein